MDANKAELIRELHNIQDPSLQSINEIVDKLSSVSDIERILKTLEFNTVEDAVKFRRSFNSFLAVCYTAGFREGKERSLTTVVEKMENENTL